MAGTTGADVAVGEEVTCQVTITVPDGTTADASLVDALPPGLAIVGLDSLVASSPLSTSKSGGFPGVAASAQVGAGGDSLTLDFGTITNANTDSSQAQTLVDTYAAVVLDAPADFAGASPTNSVTFSVEGGATRASTPVTVVEPRVGLTLTPSATTGDAGGPAITFTLVVSASAGTGADAYSVDLADALPAGFAHVVGSLANPAGQAPTTLSDADDTIAATFADLAPGATSTLTFRAALSGDTTPGQVVGDPAGLTYASIPGRPTRPRRPTTRPRPAGPATRPTPAARSTPTSRPSRSTAIRSPASPSSTATTTARSTRATRGWRASPCS